MAGASVFTNGFCRTGGVERKHARARLELDAAIVKLQRAVEDLALIRELLRRFEGRPPLARLPRRARSQRRA